MGLQDALDVARNPLDVVKVGERPQSAEARDPLRGKPFRYLGLDCTALNVCALDAEML